jgi:hypothetical protein
MRINCSRVLHMHRGAQQVSIASRAQFIDLASLSRPRQLESAALSQLRSGLAALACLLALAARQRLTLTLQV